MGIERYLCVGGIEVANPCRTLEYLGRLGNPCLVVPPSKDDCGCCPEWEPDRCDATVTAGHRATPLALCSGIFGLGPDTTWTVEVRSIIIGGCDGTRPALPARSDPGWISTISAGVITADLTVGGSGTCTPWATVLPGIGTDPSNLYSGTQSTTRCAFTNYRIVGEQTGATFDVVLWLTPGSLSDVGVPVPPGSPGVELGDWLVGAAVLTYGTGSYEVSVDGGVTWSNGEATYDEKVICAKDGVLQATMFQNPGPVNWCSGLLTGSGVGPFEVTTRRRAWAGGALPSPLPANGAPGWTVTSSVVVPVIPAIGECVPYAVAAARPSRIESIEIIDQATGHRFSVATAYRYDLLGPGNLTGSKISADDGASWTPLLIGALSFNRPQSEEVTFSTPASDDAPWYDPTVPESADVLGVFIEEAKLSVPWKREGRDRMVGSSLGPGRLTGRELVISGWLYARSEAATAYGRQWLFEALAGSGCDDCSLPDAEIYTFCQRDEESTSSGHRTLKRVGLTAFDPEIEPEFPRCCGFKFEATLTAEIPELYLAPSLFVSFDLDSEEEACNVCQPCPDLSTACTCGAVGQPPRVVPQQPLGPSGYCEPVMLKRSARAIGAPAYWREATAIVTVDGGTDGISNLRLRGWANPAGLAAPTLTDDLFACQEACLNIEIACVPPGAKLIIDGTTRRAMLYCDRVESNGFPFLSSEGGQRFAWPDVSCAGLMLVADADALHTSADATLTIEVIPRERG